MAGSERRVALRPLVLIAAIAIGLSAATLIGWKLYGDSQGICGQRPVDAAAVPVPDGFEVARSASLPPEGCGASFTRRATIAPTSGAKESSIGRYVSALTARGWTKVDCATSSWSCLDDGRHFVAIIETDGVLVVTVQPSSSA